MKKFLLLLVALFATAFVFAVPLLIIIVAGYEGSAVFPADCAVVFGAAVHQGYDEEGNVVTNTAGPGINRRVRAAAGLYREGKVKTIFLTGGTGEGMRQSEANVMKRVALQEGILPTDIVLEEQARSTEENLIYTRPLASRCATIVGVSDRYHLARIEYLAWLQGWDLQTFPASGRTTVFFEIRSIFRESLAIIYHTVNLLSR